MKRLMTQNCVISIEAIFYLLFSIMIICQSITFTYLKYSNAQLAFCFRILMEIVRCGFIILAIVLKKVRIKKRRIFYISGALIISLISVLINRKYNFYDCILLSVLYEEELDYDKLIKIFIFSMLIGVVIVSFLNIFNMLPEHVIYRSGHIERYSFGFYHPNILGFYVLAILLARLLLFNSFKEISLKSILLVFCGVAFELFVPNSMTCSAILLFTGLFIVGIKILHKFCRFRLGKKKNTMLVWLSALAVVCIFTISIYMAYNFEHSKINNESIFHTIYLRLYYASIGLKKYGLTLFGNKGIEVIDSATRLFAGRTGETFTIDTLYLWIVIYLGVIPLVYIAMYIIKCIRSAVKNRNYILLYVWIVWLVYSMVEVSMLSIIGSVFFLASTCQDLQNINNKDDVAVHIDFIEEVVKFNSLD